MVVGVLVLDINDNDPVLLNLPYNTSVSEGASIQASVARVQAQDADSGRNALLTYNITAGNLDGAFYISDTVRESDAVLIAAVHAAAVNLLHKAACFMSCLVRDQCVSVPLRQVWCRSTGRWTESGWPSTGSPSP